MDTASGSSEPPAPAPTFTNLADLANYRLRNANQNNGVSPNIAVPNANSSAIPNFVIPKFKTGQSPSYGSSSDGMTPHEMSLKKIMEMRKLHISDDVAMVETVALNTTHAHMNGPKQADTVTNSSDPQTSSLNNLTSFVVDLSAALLAKDDKVTAPPKIIPEVFDVKFVGCEISPRAALMPIITKDCEIDASGVLNERVNARTRRPSSFGKILCTQFRCKRMPYVSHEFQPKHKIVPFAFNTIHTIRKNNVKRNDI